MNILGHICVSELYASLILSHPFARGLLPAARIHNECNRHKEGIKSLQFIWNGGKKFLPYFLLRDLPFNLVINKQLQQSYPTLLYLPTC